MRTLSAIMVGILLAVCAVAEPMDKGTYEVRGGGVYNFESTDESLYVPAMGGMGYYVIDHLQVGGLISFEKRQWESAFGEGNLWGLGVFSEYVLDTGLPVMPSFGLMGRIVNTDVKTEADAPPRPPEVDNALILTVSPGLRFFVTESVALYLQLDVNMANEAIYDYDIKFSPLSAEGKRVGYALGFGFRVIY